MRLLLLRTGCALGLLLSIASCKLFDTTCDPEDRDCLSNPLSAKGLGVACTRTGECKDGLFCLDGECRFTGETRTDEQCRLTGECGDADYCGARRVCQLAGDKSVGDDCFDTSECEHGLVCEPPDLSQAGTLTLAALSKLSGSCEEAGGREQGEACASVGQCVAGLACRELQAGTGARCVSLIPLPFEPPALPLLWTGVECPKVADSDPPQSYFEVPEATVEPAAFYSLPFPNDIRRKDGHLDLSGHPLPPSSFNLPFLERYIEVAQQDLAGFSTNPVAVFRFSQPYDFESIEGVVDGKKVANVRLVDITPSSPRYGTQSSVAWKTTTGDLSNYVCPHWLGVHPVAGFPLRPGTTYAAIVTTSVKPCGAKDSKGKCSDEQDYARGKDFDALLADSAPGDAHLRAAWEAYAPLRNFIDDKQEDADAILNAAVFTTQEPEALIPKLREQIQAAQPVTISELTKCESSTTQSPCEVAGRGKCMAASEDFDEFHGRIRLPIFQQGQAPYFELAEGGGIALDANGDPIIQQRLDVCFALSIPRTPAPSDGYPVLVYAHGTGGVFNGEMDRSGFAQTLATSGEPAVLVAIDLPQHGERRGASTEEPEGLFYNFLNPRAARDNVLQGSADLMTVVRWVKQNELRVEGSAVLFDTSRIALMGHSQGATHSALIASYEPDLIGVVLSGNGGHLTTSMLTKTSPVDIAKVVPIGLMDWNSEFKLAGDDSNPALAIIQSVFDRADPVNYAGRLRREPAGGSTTGVHAFMTYGLSDTFSPEKTQQAYAVAAGLPVVAPVERDFGIAEFGLTQVVAPFAGNASINGTTRTVGMRQYRPTGEVDGHFVGVREGQPGRPDVDRFLDQLLQGKTPEIGRP